MEHSYGPAPARGSATAPKTPLPLPPHPALQRQHQMHHDHNKEVQQQLPPKASASSSQAAVAAPAVRSVAPAALAQRPRPSGMHAWVEWGLEVVRVCLVVMLTPLLLPALFMRWVGGSVVSLTLALGLMPFAVGWWFVRAGACLCVCGVPIRISANHVLPRGGRG